MKHWLTHWHLSPSDRAARARTLGLTFGLLAVTSLLAACGVSRGLYSGVVGERDDLQGERDRLELQVERLQASNSSLSRERVELIDAMEDMRQTHAQLETDLRKFQNASETLAAELEEKRRKLESREREIESVRNTFEGLVSDLESEVATGQIQIEQLREGLRVNLSGEVLFDSGSAAVNTDGQRVLTAVAARIRSTDHRIEVQGHTDNIPIDGGLTRRYPTNWELAGARASRVLRVLADGGVDPGRMIATSYGAYHPVASNESPEGRAQNRRIEIRLLPLENPGDRVAPASN